MVWVLFELHPLLVLQYILKILFFYLLNDKIFRNKVLLIGISISFSFFKFFLFNKNLRKNFKVFLDLIINYFRNNLYIIGD